MKVSSHHSLCTSPLSLYGHFLFFFTSHLSVWVWPWCHSVVSPVFPPCCRLFPYMVSVSSSSFTQYQSYVRPDSVPVYPPYPVRSVSSGSHRFPYMVSVSCAYVSCSTLELVLRTCGVYIIGLLLLLSSLLFHAIIPVGQVAQTGFVVALLSDSFSLPLPFNIVFFDPHKSTMCVNKNKVCVDSVTGAHSALISVSLACSIWAQASAVRWLFNKRLLRRWTGVLKTVWNTAPVIWCVYFDRPSFPMWLLHNLARSASALVSRYHGDHVMFVCLFV